MRVLVTGGAGFIGCHLVEALLLEGHFVVVVDDLSTGRQENIDKFSNHEKYVFKETDITNKIALQQAFDEIDWVFHLAGRADIVPSIERPEDYFNVNTQGTLNVLECARQGGVKRFVYAASSSCYGIPGTYPTPESEPVSPQYPYALTKYLGEEMVLHWAKVYGMPVISLRLFNVYGPGSRTTGAYGAVFGVFLAQKIKGQPYTIVGDGRQTRDFTYVTDVAEAFMLAAKSGVSGVALNVGSGGHYSISHLVNLLGGNDIVYLPKRPGEPDCTFADIGSIQKTLGWQAKISFEDGVKLMLNNIADWNDAPVWDASSIKKATESWFKYLS